MKLLKPGDPCPCCGKPIKTRDPERLELINLYANMAAQRREKEESDDRTDPASYNASSQRAM